MGHDRACVLFGAAILAPDRRPELLDDASAEDLAAFNAHSPGGGSGLARPVFRSPARFSNLGALGRQACAPRRQAKNAAVIMGKNCGSRAGFSRGFRLPSFWGWMNRLASARPTSYARAFQEVLVILRATPGQAGAARNLHRGAYLDGDCFAALAMTAMDARRPA